MEQRFNRNKEAVSVLGYGCMRFPTKGGAIDRHASKKLLDLAYESGVTYFDTAYTYHDGESESFVGEWIADKDRASLTVATKLPCWLIETEGDVKRVFGEQLERLGTEYIDYYLLHSLTKETWEKAKACKALEQCIAWQKEGKIRHLGFSFHDEYEVFEEIFNYYDWDFCQIQFNYMDTEFQAGEKGLRLARSKGVPVVIMEPVKGGSLATLPADALARLKQVRPDDSAARWAIRYAADQAGVLTVLSGMHTQEDVLDNVGAVSPLQPLTEAEREALGDVRNSLAEKIFIGCTGCGYCMPCPAGVNIPTVFSIANMLAVYGNKKAVAWHVGNLQRRELPDRCVECGLCERKCPQHLKIRSALKICAERFAALKEEE